MPGLIPLVLNPETAGTRSCSPFSLPQKSHLRGLSASHLHIAVCSSPTSFLPDAPRRASMPAPAKAKPAKRLSFVCPPNLPVLPYTADDWRRALADVKRHHVNHRYQACFTRCREILSNIRNASDIEPTYLISLHFYAATSLEMCTRPCLGSNTHRSSLVQQAREHYDQAAVLISQAEESVLSRSRPSSMISTASSGLSLHSPSGSMSSRAWTPDTGFSSPTPSVCSEEDRQTQRSPPRKKVSFELPKEEIPEIPEIQEVPESPIIPFIRPDSPTLGFDDDYYMSSVARSVLPEPPKQRPQTPEVVVVEEDNEVTPRARKRQGSIDMYDAEREHLRDSFLMHSSESRYCAHLMTLKAQIALHKVNLSTVTETLPSGSSELLASGTVPISPELRELDKKARIERLRKSGWPRRRFDPSRYEALRMSVLAELE